MFALVALVDLDEIAKFAGIDSTAEDVTGDMHLIKVLAGDVKAEAVIIAPVLSHPSRLPPASLRRVRSIIRDATLRELNRKRQMQNGVYGTVTSQTVGEFSISVDARQPRSALGNAYFTDSELDRLRSLNGNTRRGAFMSSMR